MSFHVQNFEFKSLKGFHTILSNSGSNAKGNSLTQFNYFSPRMKNRERNPSNDVIKFLSKIIGLVNLIYITYREINIV